jgi:hypothetical protein
MEIVIRVLSGLAGVTLFVLAGILTAGTALAAPLGMLLMRRRALRLNRPLSRVASLVGAVIASSVAALLLCIVFFAVVPRGTIDGMERQAATSQPQPTVRMPSWYGRVFPQAARADSATRQLARSREFVVVTFIFAAVMMSLFIGLVAGASGWTAAMLLVYAGRGAP